MIRALPVLFVLSALVLAQSTAQQSAPRGPGDPGVQAPRPSAAPQTPVFNSPEVTDDHHVVFRIYAPKAEAVRLVGGDIPGNGRGAAMTKADNGVWEVSMGPIDPGAYRYSFNVDGVATVDPRSPFISESNNNVSSLVYVPGADFMDTKDVPHGAVASVNYYSTVLKRWRRMHVYTPPGYELGRENSRSSTCCMEPAITTIAGLRSAALDSFWTTLSLQRRPNRWS